LSDQPDGLTALVTSIYINGRRLGEPKEWAEFRVDEQNDRFGNRTLTKRSTL
jgi:hypothetical protein